MKPRTILVLLISIFILFSLRLVTRDFYYDELVTISNFLFCPIHDIIFHYQNLNNHFFYSIINNIYLSIIGINSISTLLYNPILIRLPQLLIPIATIITLYLIRTPTVGLLSVSLLITTIPFYYYSCAIRGYGLSILLFTLLLYGIFNYNLILITISSVLFSYIMPSNIIFIIGLLLISLRDKNLVRAFLASLIITLLFYLPVIPDMFNDTQVTTHNSHIRILKETIPETIWAFISYRLLLIPILIYSLFRYHTYTLYSFKLSFYLTLITLLLFLLSGNYLYSRVLFSLLPLYCITVAEMIMKIKLYTRI